MLSEIVHQRRRGWKRVKSCSRPKFSQLGEKLRKGSTLGTSSDALWTIPGWVAREEKSVLFGRTPRRKKVSFTPHLMYCNRTNKGLGGGGEVANSAERWENLIVFLEGAKIEERGVKIKFNVVIFRPSFAGSEWEIEPGAPRKVLGLLVATADGKMKMKALIHRLWGLFLCPGGWAFHQNMLRRSEREIELRSASYLDNTVYIMSSNLLCCEATEPLLLIFNLFQTHFR